MSKRLSQRFAEFRSRVDRLPEAREPPATTLQILGRHNRERDWQRLLFYFLTPAEPHGLDHALTEHLLTALSDRDDIGYEYSAFDLANVEVATEVTTAEGRRPDAVMWAGDDWFVCWELKLTAAEGADQTGDYVETGSFPNIGVRKDDVPTEGHHYVYLAPAGAPPPGADAFVQLSWEWVADQLQSFLAASHGRFPARTTAQIDEFASTIQRELHMTDYQENQAEKAKLYLEYYDEITAAREAFEKQWAGFTETWGTQLARVLDVGSVVTHPELPESHVLIELETDEGDVDRWMFRQGHSDWGGIVKEGWWRHGDDLSSIYVSSDDADDYRLSLYHRLDENRELATRDHTLELQLWHGTKSGRAFMEAFKREVATKMDERSEVVPPTAEYTGRRGNPVTITYDIPVGEHGDFFEAYVAALHRAFIDIAVDHAEFVTMIDGIYEDLLTTHV